MIDPTLVRISPHFLLSDFVFCHSMAVFGYKNVWEDPKNTKFDEISHLCESLLEPILADFGPFSVSYGYISPALSEKIVKYQDPKKPSYHRWDAGCAVDICVHRHVLQGLDGAPIYLAHEIDQKYDYSRMITYSESPYVCLGTRLSEKNDGPRKAFYENRFMGKVKAKPLYLSKPKSPDARKVEGETLRLEHDWRGSGFPTYHGGGIRQAQHVRAGRYCMLSDFLYNTACVNEGRKNMPTPTPEFKANLYAAGRAYDHILRDLELRRLSIVRGYESPVTFRRSPYNWGDGFIFQVIPPEGVSLNDVADAARGARCVNTVAVETARRIVTIAGEPL